MKASLAVWLAWLLVFGSVFAPPRSARAEPGPDDTGLASLSIVDQNGAAVGLSVDFSPETSFYALYYYPDTERYRIHAAAANPSYSVAIVDGYLGSDTVLAANTGAAQADVALANLEADRINIYILDDSDQVLKQYGMERKFGMRGRGTAEAPYQIETAGQLDLMSSGMEFHNSKHYELVADIDLAEMLSDPDYNGGRGWLPRYLVNSSFEGNGHTISGLWADNGYSMAGFFDTLNGSDVRNLNLVLDPDKGINGSSAGGLAYSVSGSAVIENITVTGPVTSRGSSAGGLVATATGEILMVDSSFSGTVDSGGDNAGGIAGTFVGTMSHVAANAVVSGDNNVGGLIGQLYSGSVSDSSATGSVDGQDYVGGLIGAASATNPIERNTAEADVVGRDKVGGFVGNVSGNTRFVENVASGNVSGEDEVGGFAGAIQAGAEDLMNRAVALGDVDGGNQVGGLIGNAMLYGNRISESLALGVVTGTGSEYNAATGGLIGSMNAGQISDSYAAGPVTGTDYVGGLVGKVGATTAVISNSYAAGLVEGTGANVGGFTGMMTDPAFTVTGSFWDKSGRATSPGESTNSDEGPVGLAGSEMAGTAPFEAAAWDAAVWRLKAGAYPQLKWYALLVKGPPAGIGLDETEVAEDAPLGTAVGRLSVVDADEDDTYTFTLTDTEDTPDNALFSIDGTRLATNALLDYEADDAYAVRIQVADSRGRTTERTFDIQVTDVNERPTGLTLSKAETDENAPIGTIVGTLRGTDPDEGDALTFSLADGAGGDDNEAFAVEDDKLLTNAVFDYETKHSYRVRLSVSDAVYSFEDTFVIVIADKPEQPGELMLSNAGVAENEPEGTEVGTLSAERRYAHSDLLYELTSGPGDDDNGDFRIEGDKLLTNAAFDHESGATRSVRVGVIDSVYGDAYSNAKSFVIIVADANEAPTALALEPQSVEEGRPAGTTVGKLAGSDPDAGAVLTYSLAAGVGGDDNGSFRIEGEQLKTNAVFRYDAKSEYRVRVAVSDGAYTLEQPFVVAVTPKASDPGSGGDPGEGPGGNPGEDPGQGPGEDPGEDSGEDPGQNPGGDPGEEPGGGGKGGGGKGGGGRGGAEIGVAEETDAPQNVEVIVNGDRQSRLATAAVTEENGRTVVTVTLLTEAVLSRLSQEGQGTVLTIPVAGAADRVIGALDGEIVKQMEDKEAVLVIQTDTVSYTLPAARIDIGDIAARFGNVQDLSDISVYVEVASASPDQLSLLQRAAERESFEPVVMPTNFTVRAAFAGETVEVRTFDAYVEREVLLPEGVDPSRVTTGVVLREDGTVAHVPTYIVRRGDRYAVRLNSLTNSAYAVIYNPRAFADARGHWAESRINDMASRKIVSGDADGSFRPDDAVTRAEFAAFLVRGLGLSDQGGVDASYSDVRGGDWHYGAVRTASAYGLVRGFADGTFRPDDEISREQAMAMMHRAMAIAGFPAIGDGGEALQAFPDGAAVSDWAKAAAVATVRAGVFGGRTAGLEPRAAMTRAEAAVILYRLLAAARLINPLEP